MLGPLTGLATDLVFRNRVVQFNIIFWPRTEFTNNIIAVDQYGLANNMDDLEGVQCVPVIVFRRIIDEARCWHDAGISQLDRIFHPPWTEQVLSLLAVAAAMTAISFATYYFSLRKGYNFVTLCPYQTFSTLHQWKQLNAALSLSFFNENHN